jgi:hypothetical protein
MKLFTQFIDTNVVNQHLNEFSHLDVSFFHQTTPTKQEDLSKINIIAITVEPNEYFGMNDWVLQNQDLFDLILTWDDRLLHYCPQAKLQLFGNTTFIPEQYNKTYIKEFKIAHLCGNLLKSYNQSMRHEILSRENEIKIPVNFYKTIGTLNNTYKDDIDRRNGKETVFANSMFGVAIENFSHRGYFTEKIIDCFLLKTIPIYTGCSNIGDFFNTDGIIKFDNVDDFIYISNKLTSDDYYSRLDVIEDNYQRALQYANYNENVMSTVVNYLKTI